jgi:lipid A ethanolaminephosphotransferase
MMTATLFFQRLRQSLGLNLSISLWIAAVCNTEFFSQVYHYTPYHEARRGIFIAATFLLVWMYLHAVFQITNWFRLTRPLLTFYVFASAATAYFINNFGIGIDQGQIQNLLETDWQESKDLLTLNYFSQILGISIPAWLWIWWRPTIQTPHTFKQILKQKLLAITISFSLIATIIGIYYVDYAAMFREHRELRNVLTPHNSLGGLLRYFKKHQVEQLPLIHYGIDAKRINPPTQPRLVVVILGETARAQSFSLNGYPHLTTPALAALPIINYPHTTSCGTATAASVPCMFSGMTHDRYDADLAKHQEGLLDILQRAGYQVAWMDNNSGCKGTCDRVEHIPLLPNQASAWCHGDGCWDGYLVESLKDYLRKARVQDRVIVLHQAGSHGPAYYQRYPKDFARFTPTCDSNAIQGCDRQHLINTYDNTIAYTDHVIATIIKQLAQQSAYQTALLYVSDHGESTGEQGLYLHGAPYVFAPQEQIHVPMLMWLSPTFIEHYPRQAACLKSSQQRNVSHDYFFHTILGLTQVQTQVHDASLDLTQCMLESSHG